MMPANNQVPLRAPMSSKMRMASVAVPMLDAMVSRMVSQVVPRAMPSPPAAKAAKRRAIWLEP